ncbi:hypothetical protein WYMAN_142 [Vibrio phage Wyman]|nr:hypothetical protein WYMAN_142 [Vibrio phage Wyman]
MGFGPAYGTGRGGGAVDIFTKKMVTLPFSPILVLETHTLQQTLTN